jgi:hypothetical protein
VAEVPRYPPSHVLDNLPPLLLLGTGIDCGAATQSIPVPNNNKGADYLVPDKGGALIVEPHTIFKIVWDLPKYQNLVLRLP